MRSKRSVLFFSLVLFLLPLLCGCDSGRLPSDDELQHDRIVKLLDERRYNDAIDLLEPRVREGLSLEHRPLLAMAHLGAAGFEPLEIAIHALRTQAPPSSPWISDCSVSSLPHLSGERPQCILWRLARALPEADHPGLLRGRALLNEVFPEVMTTPPPINLLMATVAMGSVISRSYSLLQWYSDQLAQQKDAQGGPSISEAISKLLPAAQAILEDLKQSRSRGQHFPEEVSRLLTGSPVAQFFFGWSDPSFEAIARSGLNGKSEELLNALNQILTSLSLARSDQPEKNHFFILK